MDQKIEEFKAEIEQLRDELKLKAHLAKAEAKEEYEKLEDKWEKFKSQLKPLADEVKNTAENTGTALDVAADELKRGYKRLKKIF
ncbi:MAG: hypothetical protein MI892_15685 [Desulfobacterales bacterium]|nr:hypothetical protein [Desulfobacterales bacterium]